MLKAVIFDKDGVLIDSEPLHSKAAILVMKDFGVTIDNNTCNSFIGSTSQHMYEVFKEKYQLPVSIEELMEANKKKLDNLLQSESYPIIPYVQDLIKDLAQNNIRLAIASSSPMDAIKKTAKSLDITQFFNEFVSGCDLKNPKPAPDIFLKACELLHVLPEEALIIEDSFHGITAAKRAGITCVGYYNPNSGNQDLSQADIVIEGFDEINTSFLNDVYLRSKGEPIQIATTSRLIIRELSLDDIKHMYQIYQEPEVRKYIDDIDDYLEIELEKHRAYIKNVYQFYGYGYWGVFNKTDGTLIGRCGIQNNVIDGNLEIELGYLLDVNHWGYGYAIECTKATLEYAFYHLGIHRIVAVIDTQNTRSMKVASHIGMSIEKEIKHKNRNCYLYVINTPSID